MSSRSKPLLLNFKLLLFLNVILFFFIVYHLVSAIPIHAQNQAPVPNVSVPCAELTPPSTEFHSLRPFQANTTCSSQVASSASFCGNQLTLKETIKETYPGDGSCTTQGNVVTCNYNAVVLPHTITINLSGANLPIMGNTEDVVNSQNPTATSTLSDADLINNYTSWYLNGTLNRAELPFLDISTLSSEKVVDYSGPLNKLLPQDIQFAARANTVNQATVTRHDQVVGCSYAIEPSILGLSFLKLNLIDIPAPCYGGNIFTNLIKQTRYLSSWVGHTPPLLSNYKTLGDYEVAYKRWRGDVCAILEVPTNLPVLNIPIPIIGGKSIYLCIPSPTKEKYYSNLYSYIPFSSTEDLQGSISIDSVSSATSPTTGGVTVSGVTFAKQTPSTLFFPHMAESNEDATLLQSTFVSKGQAQVGNPTNISSDISCNTVDVRSNKGDNLFASQLSGDLGYTAKFSCTFTAPEAPSSVNGNECNNIGGHCVPSGWTCGSSYGSLDCGAGLRCGIGCTSVQTCTKDVYIALSTQSSTPDVDDVWSRLVAGPMAIFKRIFPKTNTAGSVGTIIDIPGSTTVTYSAAGVSQDSTDLKLPHIGGIYEYFLKGIQTALRPKGYGDTIEFGQTSSSSCTGGTLPSLPAGQGSCTLKSSDTLPNGSVMPPTLKAILEAAGQSYNVPPSLILGVMYGEGAFNRGKYDWTEDNVKAWSTGCASMPSCSPTTFPSQGPVPFFEVYWNKLKDAVNVVDPNRTPNPCNLMDTVFALAKDLASDKNGGNGSDGFAGKTCYGINLNSGSSTTNSCNWNQSDIETAIRVWEFGTAYNSTCGTKEGGCSNGGYESLCNGDICEKVGGSGNTSHNACVWNVAHNY